LVRRKSNALTVDLHFCQVGDLRLAYSTQGDAGCGCLVLVHGLGQQLVAWPASLVSSLVQQGYRVVRLDNRDVGKSSRVAGRPNMGWIYLRAQLGLTSQAPYLLDDMADDLCGLIEHLAAGPVHLVGASMGGMICQIAAARQPSLVCSLTSIMSSSGDHRLPKARPDVLRHILKPPKRPTFDDALTYGVRTWELIGSPRYPTPRSALVERVKQDLERGHPEAGGTERQFAAILASGSRVPLLRHITVPTLVVHGDADPLIPAEAGKHVHRHTPGARLEIIEGMGHDFPEALTPRIASLIAQHIERSKARMAPAHASPRHPRPSEPDAASLTVSSGARAGSLTSRERA
jgi:pimeloyl-ACP methyl ester carboxylesterase